MVTNIFLFIPLTESEKIKNGRKQKKTLNEDNREIAHVQS